MRLSSNLRAGWEPDLTSTYIDNQTLAGVVVALDLGHPTKWPSWVLQTALSSTCVLISVEDVRVSPPARQHPQAVRAYAGVPGNYGVIGEALSGTIQAYVPDPSLTKSAAVTVTQWAQSRPEKVSNAFEALKRDPNYGPWLDYEITKGWPTTTVILNGLVDENFLGPIGKAIGESKNTLHDVLIRSRNPDVIAKWTKSNYQSEDKEIAKILFTMGALLRGRYHDRVSELFGSNIIHHPLRDGVLKRLPLTEVNSFEAPNTLEFLGKIVLAAAMTQHTTEGRIRVWANNVAALRKAILHTKSLIIPVEDISDRDALNIAIRGAQDCAIRAHSKLLDQIVDHTLGLGLGAASSYLLAPWLFPAVWFGSKVITSKLEQGLIPKSMSRADWRLGRLAHSIPGRLRRR